MLNSYDKVFLTSGGRAISLHREYAATIWDISIGVELRTFGGSYDVLTVAANGTRAISKPRDSTPRIWDLTTGEELRTLPGPEEPITAAALTPDGSRALCAYRDGTLKVWDVTTVTEIQTLFDWQESIRLVAIAADGVKAVSSGDTLKVWDLTIPAVTDLAGITRGHQGEVRIAAGMPDGEQAVTASEDGTLKVWDLQSGTEVLSLPGERPVVALAVAMTAQGARAICAYARTQQYRPSWAAYLDTWHIRVWNLATGAVRTLSSHRSPVDLVALTPDGRYALWVSQGGPYHDPSLVYIVDLDDNSLRTLPTLPVESPLALACDGQRIVCGCRSSVRIWDFATATELSSLPIPGVAALTADTRVGVSSTDGDVLKAWDLTSGTELCTLSGYNGPASIAPDGTRVATVGYFGTVRLWDLTAGKQIGTLRLDEPSCVAAASDVPLLLVGDRRGDVHCFASVVPGPP